MMTSVKMNIQELDFTLRQVSDSPVRNTRLAALAKLPC